VTCKTSKKILLSSLIESNKQTPLEYRSTR